MIIYTIIKLQNKAHNKCTHKINKTRIFHVDDIMHLVIKTQ